MIGLLSLLAAMQTPMVSFSRPPMRLERLLPDLSKAVGQELSTSGGLRDDVLVVSVRDVAASDVLDRLAEVTGGRWVKTDVGLRLDLTKEDEAKERAAEIAKDARTLKDAIAAFANEPNPARAGNPSYDAPAAMSVIGREGISPHDGPWLDKALQEIMPLIPVEDLAKERGSVLVYTFKPNAMQRALPPEAADPIDRAIAEQNKFGEAHPIKVRSKVAPNIPNTLDPKTARVMLVVEAVDFPHYRIHLRLANAKGIVVGGVKKELIPVAEQDRENTAQALLRDESLQKALTLDGDAGEAMRLLDKISEKQFTLVKAGDALRKRMGDPIANDPLSFSLAQIFQSLGNHLNRNVVALVPDSLFDMTESYSSTSLGREGGGNPLFATVLYDLARGPMSIRSKDGWVVAQPVERLRSRREQADRRILARLFTTLLGRTLPSLDETLGAVTTSRRVVEPFRMLASLIHPPFHPYNPYDSREGVELLSLLTPAQRQSLGDGVRFDALPLAARQFISRSLLQSSAPPLSMDDPDAPKTEDEFLLFEPRGQANWLEMQPTVALPKGVPGNAVLTGTVEIRKDVVPSEWVERQDPRYGSVYDAKGLIKCSRVTINLELRIRPGVGASWVSDFKAR